MARIHLPFHCVGTPDLMVRLGTDLTPVAQAATRALFRASGNLEIAHQQIVFAGIDVAFSARLNRDGDLVVTLGLGAPHLADRIVLEADLRRAHEALRSGARRRGLAT
jgi:hypothetical protein